MYLDFVHEALANTKPKGLIQQFQASIAAVLEVIYEEDRAVCLLHREKTLVHSIRGTEDFEGKTYREWGQHFRFDRPNYSTTATKERAKKIRGTICIGTAKPTRAIIEACQTDMAIASDIQFYCKGLQVWETSDTIAFPCCSNEIPSSTMTDMVTKLTRENELIFMEKYPEKFPAGIHGGDMPEFMVINGWEKGTPFVDPRTRGNEDTSYRKMNQISMNVQDTERMIPLFREIKKKGLEKELFGEHADIGFQPIKGEQHEKESWAKKVRFHGTVMRNTGSATFPGLEQPDVETEMERYEPTNDGSGTYITTKTTTSVRKLLTNLKGRDGRRLWQTLFPSWDGEWTGTFIGTDEGTLAETRAISACLASYLRILCARCGYTKKSIIKLLTNSFDDQRLNSAQGAKWDRKRRRVIPGSFTNNAWRKMASDSRLDMSLGMTTGELAEHSRREREMAAAEIQLPQGGKGSMEAFETGAGTSVAGTVVEDEDRTNTGKSVAQSRYSIKDGSLGSFGCSEDEDDASNLDEENRMEIEIPTGGLEAIEGKAPLRDWSEEEDGMPPLLHRFAPEDDESTVNPTKLNLDDDGAHENPVNQQFPSGQQTQNANTANNNSNNTNNNSNNNTSNNSNNNHSNHNPTTTTNRSAPTNNDIDHLTDAAKRYYCEGLARKATLLAWHTGTKEKALREQGNTYAIIGTFPRFQKGADDEEDTVRGRCRVAGMIADFGGKPIGFEVTIDTNYVIVGVPPHNVEHRRTYKSQLKEAKLLELPLTSINGIMKRIGVKASNITDDDGNQRKPLYLHEQAGPYTYNMYRSRSVEEEITFSTDTAAVLASAESRTNVEASREVNEVEECQKPPENARLVAAYHDTYYQDSDGELQERGDDSGHQSDDEYDRDYYQDSDGEVRERGEETGYQSGDLSDFEDNISIGSNEGSSEQPKAVKKIRPALPAPYTTTTTNTTSSSPSGGDGDQVITPAQTERKGLARDAAKRH